MSLVKPEEEEPQHEDETCEHSDAQNQCKGENQNEHHQSEHDAHDEQNKECKIEQEQEHKIAQEHKSEQERQSEQIVKDDGNDEHSDEEAGNKKDEKQGPPKTWLTTRVEDSLDMQITMKPIAIFKSCFSRKNGTPRQGAIVPHSKGYLKLIPDNCFGKLVSHHALINLTDFSHVWLIYYFHDNRKNFTKTKPKAKPPRLNGAAVGLFATRSPHVRFSVQCSVFSRSVDLSVSSFID